jgi:hypothetical protein
MYMYVICASAVYKSGGLLISTMTRRRQLRNEAATTAGIDSLYIVDV